MRNIFFIIFILVFSFISKSLACDHCEHEDPTIKTTRHNQTSADYTIKDVNNDFYPNPGEAKKKPRDDTYPYREDIKKRHEIFHSHKRFINTENKEHKTVEFGNKDGNLKKDKGIEINKNLDVLDLSKYKDIVIPLKQVEK